MKMKNLIPQTMYPAEQMLAGMLISCGNRIDELEEEVKQYEEKINQMTYVLEILGKNMELHPSSYADQVIRTEWIYKGNEGFNEIVKMLNLKLEEEE